MLGLVHTPDHEGEGPSGRTCILPTPLSWPVGERTALIGNNEEYSNRVKISAVHGHSKWRIQKGSQSNVSAMAPPAAAGMDNEQTRPAAGLVCLKPWQGRFTGPNCSTDGDGVPELARIGKNAIFF